MIKKKTMYEASDGTLLPSRDAAQTYNDIQELYTYVDANPIYTTLSDSGKPICNGQQIGLWLRDNPCIFMKYLHGGECPQGQDDMEDLPKPPQVT